MPELTEPKASEARALNVSNQTVAQHIVSSLKRHGVSVLIGQSIPSALYLAGADDGVEQILVRAEKSGAMIADGYARVSHKVAVTTSVGGPATPLMMAGMGEAFHASIPMVALFQVPPRHARDKNFAQDFDDYGALKTVTKFVAYVDRADRIDDYIDRAFVIAASGRPGPVALLLPPDLLEEAADGANRRSATFGIYPLDRTVADPAQIRAAASLLAEARRPVVIAGGGVHSSGAYDELAWFQELLGIPVATTIMGKGAVAETNELSLGVSGYVMGKGSLGHYTRKLIDEADLIFLIGTRTNQSGTNGWKLYPRDARFIHCDVDSQEIGRNYESLRLLGDARLTLAALRAELEKQGVAAFRSGKLDVRQAVAEAKRRHADDIAEIVASDAVPARPERIMRELDRVVDENMVMCADASYATVWLALYIASRKAGMRFITPRGLAGIGWGFPIALGCALADRTRKVVNISGDGGFGYAWSEMETAVRHRLNIVQLVLNNSVLGYQKDAEDASYARHTDGLHLKPVDHAQIARACGWAAFRVEAPGEIAPALKAAFSASGPVLIDVISDPAAWPPIQNFEGKIPESFS